MSMRFLLPVVAICALVACDSLPESVDDPSVTGKSARHSSGAFSLAQNAKRSGDLNSAAELYRQSIEREPQRMEAYVELADILRKRRDYAEAESVLRSAREKQPDNAPVLTTLGFVLLHQNRPKEAETLFEQVLSIQSDNASALNGKAVSLDHQTHHAEAQSLYRRALASHANNVSVKNNYALSLALSGKADEAVQILEPLAMEANASPTMRQNLALAYGLAGEKGKAEDIAAKDLKPEQVAQNLAFYERVRQGKQVASMATSPVKASPVVIAREENAEDRFVQQAVAVPVPVVSSEAEKQVAEKPLAKPAAVAKIVPEKQELLVEAAAKAKEEKQVEREVALEKPVEKPAALVMQEALVQEEITDAEIADDVAMTEEEASFDGKNFEIVDTEEDIQEAPKKPAPVQRAEVPQPIAKPEIVHHAEVPPAPPAPKLVAPQQAKVAKEADKSFEIVEVDEDAPPPVELFDEGELAPASGQEEPVQNPMEKARY